MATMADSLVSSSARRLALRKRPDLSARRQRYQGRNYWVVKEPVGLNYFRFQDEEFAILEMLDGESSLDDIKERFEDEFPPQKITLGELQQFIGTLHRSGLVIADVPGQGYQLKKRRDERRRKELFGSLTNILCIRFKGIDPERLLNRLYPWVRLAFTRTAVVCAVLLALSAMLLVTVQFDVFRSKLPGFHQFFSIQNAFVLAIALGVTKILHELGHGLTCKHFGGECHEIGVMILVLTPCLYCNVSDSWMLPNKWHRAAIGAAGMYVEIVIASICTFIWWFSEPGFLNYLCLSTMFVCSVSTLIFNGNPLLRYDGYYILSDIMEVPNLRQKATSILNRKLGWLCLGLESPDDPFLPERNQALFATYTVAAVVYRWFVVISILFFLNKVFEPYRLQIIGQIIAAGALYGLLIQPMWNLAKFMRVPGRIEKVKKPRLAASVAVVSLVIAGVALIPVPHHVMCPLEIEPRDAASVYVAVAGTLDEILVKPGDRVDPDQPLARLSNDELSLKIVQLEGQEKQYDVRLANLDHQAFADPYALAQRQPALTGRDYAREQLAERQADFEKLVLRAPTAGIVLPPRMVPPSPKDEDELSMWHGTPLEEKNLGCTLTEGTTFCYVGDPATMKATLVIDQADYYFVRDGQNVEIMLDQLPGRRFQGTIERTSQYHLRVSPRQLSNKAGGELPTVTDPSGVERPMSTSYQARVPLDDEEGILRIGLRGRAKIDCGSMPLGKRIWRYLATTFNFTL